MQEIKTLIKDSMNIAIVGFQVMVGLVSAPALRNGWVFMSTCVDGSDRGEIIENFTERSDSYLRTRIG